MLVKQTFQNNDIDGSYTVREIGNMIGSRENRLIKNLGISKQINSLYCLEDPLPYKMDMNKIYNNHHVPTMSRVFIKDPIISDNVEIIWMNKIIMIEYYALQFGDKEDRLNAYNNIVGFVNKGVHYTRKYGWVDHNSVPFENEFVLTTYDELWRLREFTFRSKYIGYEETYNKENRHKPLITIIEEPDHEPKLIILR